MGRMSSPQMQHNQQTQPAYYTPSLFEEKMDDEEFNRLARDVSDSENGFDDDFNEILYHAQTADSTSDASDIEELAMQEVRLGVLLSPSIYFELLSSLELLKILSRFISKRSEYKNGFELNIKTNNS